MASNSFGNLFRMTTWGESHGPAIGVIIDGCPAGIEISEQSIRTALQARAPGKTTHTSSRKEPENAVILSGIFEGNTTGAPICIMIPNVDADSRAYEGIKDLLRPGHANYTYLKKYGIFDYRGGGRASARETACRVAAGSVAKEFLASCGISSAAYVKQIGALDAGCDATDLLEMVERENDSVGGVVEFCARGLPAGLGDPVYEKLDALLAYALMGIPGSKGVEIGSGFSSASMRGSEYTDLFVNAGGAVETETNHAGGILGGISNGMPLTGRVAFKPASSIRKEMKTLTVDGSPAVLKFGNEARHDPCIAIRAVPVVEAMVNLVLADAVLMNRCARL